jgi:hypothetical protein
MIVLSLLGLAFMGLSLTESNVASNWRDQTQAFYAAEAGIEAGFAGLKTLLRMQTPNPSDAQLDDVGNTARSKLSVANFSFSELTVRRPRPTPYRTRVDSGSYKGLQAFSTDYQITAEVTGPKGSRARLIQVVQYMQIPMFQFGVFYGRGVDLEITPSPAATLTGWVHANGNLYTKEWTDLRYDGRVTAAGNILRYVKPEPSDRAGDPKIKDATGVYRQLNFDHDSNVGFSGSWTEAEWRQKALEVFKGTVLDSAHGVQEIIPPIPGPFYDSDNPDVSSHKLIEKGDVSDTPELKAEKMYYKADLRIENGVAKRRDNSSVSLAPGVIKTKTFYDPREMKDITVTQVDVEKLKDNLPSLFPDPKAPFNGILWVHQDGSNKGVRLVDGKELPSGGFTVASENPIYIMGDYNTKNKVPAAVMGDAIYVLSNNWESKDYDNKTKDDYTERPAKDTEVNAAFMLGPHAENKEGDGSNGYFENIMRFLEDWRRDAPYPTSKTDLTYNGSIVSLWHSKQAKASMSRPDKVTFRTPPNRWWNYETLFDTQLPPGTPSGILIMKGRWWQE